MRDERCMRDQKMASLIPASCINKGIEEGILEMRDDFTKFFVVRRYFFFSNKLKSLHP